MKQSFKNNLVGLKKIVDLKEETKYHFVQGALEPHLGASSGLLFPW